MRLLNKYRNHIPADAAYIGRGSKWGNPYKIGKDGTREEVIAMYEQYIRNKPELLDCLHELRGHDIVCFCAPLPCHGDVLIKLIKEMEEEHEQD